MILAMAGMHEPEITPGEYGPLPWLRWARALRVDPESEGPEGLGPDRPLRHVSGNRAGTRSLGERPEQMTWFLRAGRAKPKLVGQRILVFER